MSAEPSERRDVPDATVARLPEYLRALRSFAASGTLSVSSEDLALATGVSSAKVRKDLSHLGSHGVRGVGYDVNHLAAEIADSLGLAHDWSVAIVGMGNLGRAIAAYSGLATKGLRVVALLDHDPTISGDLVAGLPVRPMGDLPELVADGLAIGVITTPAAGAQEACDALVRSGVRAILNFAPVVLTVPAGVTVRKVDLSTELQILAFHEQRNAHEKRDALREVAR